MREHLALAWHHDLALAVHAVAMRAIEGWYRDEARALGIAHGKTGSITAIQRLGSDLALSIHFHALVLDGVYDARGEFTAIAAPTLDAMERLVFKPARGRSESPRSLTTAGTPADDALCCHARGLYLPSEVRPPSTHRGLGVFGWMRAGTQDLAPSRQHRTCVDADRSARSQRRRRRLTPGPE